MAITTSGSPVHVDASDLRRLAQQYRIKQDTVTIALARSINRGGDAATVQARKALVAATGIKDRDSRRSRGISRTLATPADLRYTLKIRSQWTPLSYFRPTQTDAGVRANPWNRSTTFAGTFLVRMSSGYVGVFRRDKTGPRAALKPRGTNQPKKARPIVELWGPSLAVELMRNDIPGIFQRTAIKATAARLPHEIEFALGKIGAQRMRRAA